MAQFEADTPSQPIPSEPHPGGRGRTILLGAIGVIIAALLAAILAVLLMQGDNNREEATDANARDSFTVSGQLQLIGDVDGTQEDCYGAGGYSDLSAGTQVVIRDADGSTVAVGELEQGFEPEKFRLDSYMVACSWPFHVDDVPSGSAAYSVEVAHRGEVSFTQNEADSLFLSLGS